MTREEAKNNAYKETGHNAYFGNGFDAGVNYAIETIEDRIKELEDARSASVFDNSITKFTHEINALRLIKYDLKK